MKILMVCLGNICRSPLAEGILKSKLGEDFFVDSAGTISMHEGQNPDRRSVKIAKNYGLDISKQCSRPIRKADLQTFDLIYCMDKNNYEDVLSLAKNEEEKAKVRLILEEGLGKKGAEVPDPYFGGEEGFDRVYTMLHLACETIATNLLAKKH